LLERTSSNLSCNIVSATASEQEGEPQPSLGLNTLIEGTWGDCVEERQNIVSLGYKSLYEDPVGHRDRRLRWECLDTIIPSELESMKASTIINPSNTTIKRQWRPIQTVQFQPTMFTAQQAFTSPLEKPLQAINVQSCIRSYNGLRTSNLGRQVREESVQVQE